MKLNYRAQALLLMVCTFYFSTACFAAGPSSTLSNDVTSSNNHSSLDSIAGAISPAADPVGGESKDGYVVYTLPGITIVSAGKKVAFITHDGKANSADVGQALGHAITQEPAEKGFKEALKALKRALRKFRPHFAAFEYPTEHGRRGVYTSGDLAHLALKVLGKPERKHKSIPYKAIDVILPASAHSAALDVSSIHNDGKFRYGLSSTEVLLVTNANPNGDVAGRLIAAHNTTTDQIAYWYYDYQQNSHVVKAVKGSGTEFLKQAGYALSVPLYAIKLVNSK